MVVCFVPCAAIYCNEYFLDSLVRLSIPDAVVYFLKAVGYRKVEFYVHLHTRE